jgi:homoserine O-acetyltransferase/O-succinyltransferase
MAVKADPGRSKNKHGCHTDENSVGLVETKFFTFAESPNEMPLDSGKKIGPITLAYETYGQLNEDRTNAVLIAHALSGDAHAAGWNSPEDRKPGWWDMMIGPGKAFDTDKYFFICSNILGGCKGSTGPTSINPETGKEFGMDFPIITIGDIVRAQNHLIEHLGIEKLLSVCGGSMGGMQTIEWARAYPEKVFSAIPVATTARMSAQSIAFDEVGRLAIMADQNWNKGKYYGGDIPKNGLALARMIAHITYLSDESMRQKFGRRLQDSNHYSFDFIKEFEVESYLHHQGNVFTQRFDANSYLFISKAMDYYDPAGQYDGNLTRALNMVKSRFLIISFTTDWLFPPYQSRDLATALRKNGAMVSYANIESDFGHDAFLLEKEHLAHLFTHFLAHRYEELKKEVRGE